MFALSSASQNLKHCPYCSEQIQQDAVKCRFCGEWLSRTPPPNEAPAAQEWYETHFVQKVLPLIVFAIILGGLAVVVAAQLSRENQNYEMMNPAFMLATNAPTSNSQAGARNRRTYNIEAGLWLTKGAYATRIS